MSLENTPAARISALAAAQKTYFRSGATLSEAFRRTMLRRLDAALANWEKRLCDALWTIGNYTVCKTTENVAPFVGAWIEIGSNGISHISNESLRSSERGLKSF